MVDKSGDGSKEKLTRRGALRSAGVAGIGATSLSVSAAGAEENTSEVSRQTEWQANFGTPRVSDFTVAGNKVYVGVEDEVLTLNRNTGSIISSRRTNGGGVVERPRISGDSLFVATISRIVKLSNHSSNWSVEPPRPVSGTVVLPDQIVVLQHGDSGSGTPARVTSFDKSTGGQKWEQTISTSNPGDITTGQATDVIVSGGDGSIRGYDTEGKKKWLTSLDNPCSTKLLADRGGVFTVDTHGIGYRVSQTDGSTNWTIDLGGQSRGTAPSTDKSTVIFSAETGVHAVEAQTGDQRWKLDTESPASSAEAHKRGVYVSSLYGEFYSVDLESGAKRWEMDLPDAVFTSGNIAEQYTGIIGSPSRVGETVYAQTASGELIATNTGENE